MKTEKDAEGSEISILFEDDNVIALYKPAGVLTHGDERSASPSITDWLLEHRPEIQKEFEQSEEEGPARPGIVHRLDRDTSGVLLVAKNLHSFGSLKKQFALRKVQKEYHAFVYGTILEERGIINRPLGRSRKDFRLRSGQRKARGELKEAVTVFEVAGRREDKSATFIKAYPKTGRTHQIRAHMKAVHHPVVCDKLYAPGQKCLFGMERLALHARRITFKDILGKDISVEAPYPRDFAKALEAFRAK